MSPLRRFGEINFYEELGVAQDASPEEIRDAFRALVRLLHPDQQTDIQLKQIAEKQMRKLNPIYAVLSDPARRRQYDIDLQEGYAPAIIVNPPPPGEFRRPNHRVEWFGAAIFGAAFLIWLASTNLNTPAAPIHEQAAATAPADVPPAPPAVQQDKEPDPQDRLAADDARFRAELKEATARRDAAIREYKRVAALPVPRTPATPKPAAARIEAAELPAPAPRPTLQLAPEIVAATNAPNAPAPNSAPRPARIDAPVPQSTRLTGNWVYVKPAAGQNPALPNTSPTAYPPEYIQTSITEENGTLRGRYRSRFRISDRAISPDVNFTFSGTPNGSTMICPWVGSGGAKGRLTLRLTAENLLKIDWVTLEFGTDQGLVSGSALLTRKTE